MNPVTEAFLSSWPSDPGLLVALFLTAGIYLKGWLHLHQRDPQRWHRSQPAAFLGGLTTIFLALASPIEPFSYLFLQVHMVQHLLLMMAAPPLLWLGHPLFPILRGLPAPIRTYWVAPLFRSPTLRSFFRWLTHPVPALLLYVGATWFWHVPALYEIALRSDGWHYVEHLTFLVAGLLFWFPVVRPYPSRPHWSRWLLLPFLIVADVQNTVLAALLTFSDRVLYPHYAQIPRLEGLSALDDQATAGALMWVPGSVVYLVPLFVIAIRSLFGTESHFVRRDAKSIKLGSRISLPLASSSSHRREEAQWDLLHVPYLGRFLHWRRARLCMQMPLLILAALVIDDGLTGPAAAPMNLAGVLPWIHWRGLLIIGLLILGNVFCMACPFMVPRMLARRLFPQRFSWPRRLRNKWFAALLLGLFLWSYEAFALWDSPWWTAWIAIGYFVGALIVDGLFRGAAFCKYVCPIGQLNFVQSLISPWAVKVRDHGVCTSCRTKDCIRGRPATTGPSPTPARRGCELDLFVPRKSSNLDCTLCLDCIHACPHDNIGIIAGAPAAELWRDPKRTGIGRWTKRSDLAFLVLLLVFGAFANAAGMVEPVVRGQDWLGVQLGQQSLFWPVAIYYLLALVVLPSLVIGMTWRLQVSLGFIYALAPLGFAMWLSHYSFHLLMGYDTVVPAAQRFVGSLGINVGNPDWSCSCCRPVADWVLHLEIVILDVGLLLSLYTGYRVALADSRTVLKSLAPWALLIVLVFAAGIWIVLQPMEMRGMMSSITDNGY